jgi:membrane-associated phospholipid phosphatase
MRSLTDFGDAMVVLPVAAATLFWLARIGGWRTALLWCAALAACGGGTALLKVYFSACASPVAALNSPSGHASMSTLVYGGLALIIGAEASPWQRFAAGALGIAVVLGIALSRVLLGAHSTIEVVVGCVIGGAALALFAKTYLDAKPAVREIGPFVVVVAILMLALHGHAAHLEPLWRAIVAYLHNNVGLCRA